jgi:hypothetical protein
VILSRILEANFAQTAFYEVSPVITLGSRSKKRRYLHWKRWRLAKAPSNIHKP